jgi:hypothetical protein
VQAVRVIGAVVGVVVALLTVRSIVLTMVVPRPRSRGVARVVDEATDRLFQLALRIRDCDYDSRDRLLAIQAPVYLFALLATWLLAFLVAYALLLWPWTHGLGGGFRQSMSSLFTLGFDSSRSTAPTVLDGLAAASGITVVAVQVGYLPTLYSAFNRRETEVTLLEARAGSPPWGPELLARTRYGMHTRTDDLPAFYLQWERWAADVAESHANYPVLVRFRSPQPLTSWLVGLIAVLDSAALYLAVCPSRDRYEVRMCLRMGFTALRHIGCAVGIQVDPDPDPDQPIQLSYTEFAAGVQRLVDVGFPVERSAAEAWPHFRGWRINYEAPAYALAARVDAVPALWSGPRRWAADPMPPQRPPARIASDAT